MPTLVVVLLAFAFGTAIALIVNLLSRNNSLTEELNMFKADNSSKQQIILTLIKEKESRITAQQLAETYVPVRAYELVTDEVADLKFKLDNREQQVIELTKSIT